MAIIEIKVPDIGDFDEVAVIELLVKPGDSVQAEQSLITVESDKASMEIPSSAAGVVKELKIALGDKVKQGSVVLLLEVAGVAAVAAGQFLHQLGLLLHAAGRAVELHQQHGLLAQATPLDPARPVRPMRCT